MKNFRKSAKEIQVSLISLKKNGYFTRIPVFIYDGLSLKSSRIRNVSDKSCKYSKSKHTLHVK